MGQCIVRCQSDGAAQAGFGVADGAEFEESQANVVLGDGCSPGQFGNGAESVDGCLGLAHPRLGAGLVGHLVPRQLLFAHAALSDLGAARLRHDQRIARAGFGVAEAAEDDTRLVLRGWRLARSGPPEAGVYRARIAIPSSVPVGSYTAQIFLIKNGEVIAQSTSQQISEARIAARSAQLRQNTPAMPLRRTAFKRPHTMSNTI